MDEDIIHVAHDNLPAREQDSRLLADATVDLSRLFPLSALEHSAFVFGGLLIYTLITRIGHQHRHPSSAIAWVLAIATFPYAAIPLFLLFGTRKIVRPGRKAREPSPASADQENPVWVNQLLTALDVPPLTHNNSIVFHEDGPASHQALLTLIEQAQHQIDVCTFILGTDTVGTALADALIQRATAGVRVRLLLDAIGSLQISRRRISILRAGGVAVRWFMPILHNPQRGRSNLRNHRKMLIVDGNQFWSGGRNLSVEYFFDDSRKPAWVDLSFVVQGSLAKQALQLFERDWQMASGQEHLSLPILPKTTDPTGSDLCARLIPSGPDRPDDTVYALLLAAAYQARHRIMAVNPYFVPDDALLSAWTIACRRGVKFTLLIPRRSNHRLADLARERALRELVEAGAQVLLYPAMIHAKAVIIDDDLALCGSANLDGRSLFLNFELMTAFFGPHQIAWLAGWMERHMQRSTPYKAKPPSLARDVVEGLARVVAFQL